MTVTLITFGFGRDVPVAQLQDTVALCQMAAESLFGPERVALEAAVSVDAASRSVVLRSGGGAGDVLGRLLLGFAWREFGRDAVQVRVEEGRWSS